MYYRTRDFGGAVFTATKEFASRGTEPVSHASNQMFTQVNKIGVVGSQRDKEQDWSTSRHDNRERAEEARLWLDAASSLRFCAAAR